MKYNITNCPAFDKNQYECISQDTDYICCWRNEDCLIKQIVERANICLTPEVIELLEIEEIDEHI